MAADTIRLTFSDSPTEEEARFVHDRLEQYNRAQTHGEYDQPGIEIGLVLRGSDGSVVGGVTASTMLRVMHLEALWVAKEYRNLGHASRLVLRAERIGLEKGCIASQTQSFSFQAPGFYQKIGYTVLGIYDGYPDGITEYTLMKRLRSRGLAPAGGMRTVGGEAPGDFSITEPAAPEELNAVHWGLGAHVDEFVGAERDNPGIGIRLVVKDATGQVMGGLLAWTTLRNMILDDVWLDERCRGRGLGARLMTEAERIARRAGCIACQTYSFSFQAPQFFQRLGYEVYGISDGYPRPVTQYCLIKRF
ncbi:MAG: GNAT family N-acetyltransferase [Anaerolineae bacterium]|nr:GNAT family N-acetyltransferase [Anaerolineae bacterium]